MAATRTTQRRRGATRRRSSKKAASEETEQVSQQTPSVTNLRVVHFQINADDVERAVGFYREVFGWEINKWDSPEAWPNYYMADTGPADGPGINGAIMPRIDFHASTINTIEVPDIDEYLEKIVGAGGKVVQDKAKIQVGYFAYVMDTEGNLLGILQPSGDPM